LAQNIEPSAGLGNPQTDFNPPPVWPSGQEIRPAGRPECEPASGDRPEVPEGAQFQRPGYAIQDGRKWSAAVFREDR